MYKIQKMAEIVKEKGVMIVTFDNAMKPHSRRSFRATQLFWEALEKNNPFVFSLPDSDPQRLASDEEINNDFAEFESPFETFSIEMPNKYLTVDYENTGDQGVNIDCVLIFNKGVKTWHDTILQTLDMIEKYDSSKTVLSAEFDDSSPNKRSFAFILYKIQGQYHVLFDGMWEAHKNEHGNPQMLFFNDFDPGVLIPQNFISHLTKAFTGRLNQENTVGIQEVNLNIHYRGKHEERKAIKIRKIVHIVPKKYRPDYVSKMGVKVEWSHRFWRRGTWVSFYNPDGTIDFSKIGKNREGEYIESGRTWRIESEVNKDKTHLPLIQKTRLLINKEK